MKIIAALVLLLCVGCGDPALKDQIKDQWPHLRHTFCGGEKFDNFLNIHPLTENSIVRCRKCGEVVYIKELEAIEPCPKRARK
jgi:hypothetical protein